ncbi:unnamed protein product [Leptidea sinapis]|uniref:Uncharacterized protein n=1 Tax=Leptidea sinapis TaxID=189913 RepID=A0A5E4QEA0_9NEOP|nr:unnamed protein product [Leptidea sinapis]
MIFWQNDPSAGGDGRGRSGAGKAGENSRRQELLQLPGYTVREATARFLTVQGTSITRTLGWNPRRYDRRQCISSNRPTDR